MADSTTRNRGLKLHSIIEKLSEQCERKSPIPDEDGEGDLVSGVLEVKRKQRKRNEVKKVNKETSSRSSSEDELTFDPADTISVDKRVSSKALKQLELKVDKRGKTQTTETNRHCQQGRGTFIVKKNVSSTKINYCSNFKVSLSAAIRETGICGSENDLAIDVDAFVNHGPVIEDVDQAMLSLCPFCSVMHDDITQHIKDCHKTECTVVDNSDDDNYDEGNEDDRENGHEGGSEGSDASYIPEEDSDSDEETKPKRKKPRQRNKKSPKSFPGKALSRDVKNKNSGMDVERPMKQSSSATIFHVSCFKCGLNFESKEDLTSHVSVCMEQDRRPLFHCDECGQICVSVTSLEKHKLLHSEPPKERSHKCSQCDAAFAQKSYLKRHSVIHTGIKEFECDFCHRMFTRLRSLKEHRRLHTGEKPYKCEFCEAAFANYSSLRTHVTKHTGNLQYKCQICGKMFAKSYGLKMHAISHSNDKPFVCEVCGKAFKRPDHFKQHKIIHSDSKPFKCDTCQRTFNQKVCLRKHLPCREQEKQQKKLQKSLVNKKTKADNKRKRQPASMPSTGKNKSTVSLKTNLKERNDNRIRNEAAKGLNCCNVTNDVNLASSVDASPSEGSILSRCYSPPSFVRPTPKLIDSDDYSVSSESSFQPERDMSALLSLPQNMFSCEDDTLSLDSPLPPLSSHVTHGLPGRPPIVDSSTDLGCILLDSSMASENLASIVEEASSLFV